MQDRNEALKVFAFEVLKAWRSLCGMEQDASADDPMRIYATAAIGLLRQNPDAEIDSARHEFPAEMLALRRELMAAIARVPA